VKRSLNYFARTLAINLQLLWATPKPYVSDLSSSNGDSNIDQIKKATATPLDEAHIYFSCSQFLNFFLIIPFVNNTFHAVFLSFSTSHRYQSSNQRCVGLQKKRISNTVSNLNMGHIRLRYWGSDHPLILPPFFPIPSSATLAATLDRLSFLP
jgi:hypothetical protein